MVGPYDIVEARVYAKFCTYDIPGRTLNGGIVESERCSVGGSRTFDGRMAAASDGKKA